MFTADYYYLDYIWVDFFEQSGVKKLLAWLTIEPTTLNLSFCIQVLMT